MVKRTTTYVCDICGNQNSRRKMEVVNIPWVTLKYMPHQTMEKDLCDRCYAKLGKLIEEMTVEATGYQE